MRVLGRRLMVWLLLAIALILGIGYIVYAAGGGAAAPRQRPAPHPRSTIAHKFHRRLSRHRPSRPILHLARPSVTHPLTILSIGDSLGEDLGYGLRDILGSHRNIRLIRAAVGSTGLVNTAYYNWPLKLKAELATYHPQLVVVLMGGNDALSFNQNGHFVKFGSSLWRRDYGARVATMMNVATRAGARMIWVGLPIMGPKSVLPNSSMKALNSVYQAQAQRHPGVIYLSGWKVFQGPDGQYVEYLKNRTGMSQIVRDSDGVHIAPPAGQELIATAVIGALDRATGLRICPSNDIWHRYLPPFCQASKPIP